MQKRKKAFVFSTKFWYPKGDGQSVWDRPK